MDTRTTLYARIISILLFLLPICLHAQDCNDVFRQASKDTALTKFIGLAQIKNNRWIALSFKHTDKDYITFRQTTKHKGIPCKIITLDSMAVITFVFKKSKDTVTVKFNKALRPVQDKKHYEYGHYISYNDVSLNAKLCGLLASDVVERIVYDNLFANTGTAPHFIYKKKISNRIRRLIKGDYSCFTSKIKV